MLCYIVTTYERIPPLLREQLEAEKSVRAVDQLCFPVARLNCIGSKQRIRRE